MDVGADGPVDCKASTSGRMRYRLQSATAPTTWCSSALLHVLLTTAPQMCSKAAVAGGVLQQLHLLAEPLVARIAASAATPQLHWQATCCEAPAAMQQDKAQ